MVATSGMPMHARSTAPTADRPVVVCHVAHPQDACVQFFGSDGNIRAARVTVLGLRPVLENGQVMPLVQAFEQLERERQEREQRWHERLSASTHNAQSRAHRIKANYERHGDPSPWDVDQEQTRDTGGVSRLRVEMVQPPVVK